MVGVNKSKLYKAIKFYRFSFRGQNSTKFLSSETNDDIEGEIAKNADNHGWAITPQLR